MIALDRTKMGRLADIYVNANPGFGPSPLDLEDQLVGLCTRGRVARPTFSVDDESFVAHLARCGAAVEDGLALHAEDLFLACACLAGDHTAVAQLHAESKDALGQHLSRIRGALAIREEVEQQLWSTVLVGTGGAPKLATYAGRGPITAWMGVAAQRVALMALRQERAEARARQEASAQVSLVDQDPELVVIKERFREQLNAAVAAALACLTDREKTIFRLHLVDRLTLETIGRSYGVHHSTVLRWLAAARERIVEEAKAHLRATMPISTGEFDSIARLLLSQLDLNISRALDDGR
jgi:RNA polymerase sigma-70 factor, ECF subfamily